MRINISTKVKSLYEKVFLGFNRELFIKLNPPLLKFNLRRFDGCKKNDLVEIELDFVFFKQNWISLITEYNKDMEEIYFVDKGIQLPFFLKTWEHKHRILKLKDGTKIIDDINYTTPFKILDFIIYPVMFIQFFYRKNIYKSFFND